MPLILSLTLSQSNSACPHSVNEKNGGFNELATFAFDASKFCGDVEKRVELCQSRSTGRNGFLEVRAVAVIDCVPGKVRRVAKG